MKLKKNSHKICLYVQLCSLFIHENREIFVTVWFLYLNIRDLCCNYVIRCQKLIRCKVD